MSNTMNIHVFAEVCSQGNITVNKQQWQAMSHDERREFLEAIVKSEWLPGEGVSLICEDIYDPMIPEAE